MQLINWQPTLAIESPIYLDANILVGITVSNHPLYTTCVQLVASILIKKSSILISAISMDECMWATTKLAYCQLTNTPPNSGAHWSKKIYSRWCDKIFNSPYGVWVSAVSKMIVDLKKAGVTINLVPDEDLEFENIIELAPGYMNKYKLTPADAFHLAIAEKKARSFITADSDFNGLQSNLPSGELTIIHIDA